MLRSSLLRVFAAACCAATVTVGTHAQTLLDTTLTLGKPDPIVLSFTVPATGNYRVTVTDFGVAGGPARLARADVGITHGSTLVTTASVLAANSSPVTTKTFAADAGQYRLTMVGRPNAPSTVGSAGVRVDDPATGAVLLDTVQVFRKAAAPVTSPAFFQHDVAVSAAGTYTVETTDFALPQAAQAFQTTVIRLSDVSVVADVPGATTVQLNAAGPDTFRVLVYVELAAGVQHGIAGVNVRDANSGATLFAQIDELGDWPLKYPFTVAGATTLTSQLTDFGFPSPLAVLGAAVVGDGRRALPPQTGAGTVSGAVVAGDYTAYVDGMWASGSTAGSFGLQVTDGAATHLVEVVQNIIQPAPVTDVETIHRDFDVTAAGDYTLTLTDFGAAGFFDAFTSLQLGVTRGNQLVASATAPGNVALTGIPAGHYSIVIIADPAGTNGQGLVGLRVAGGPANAVVFEDTAAVGTGFISATVTVGGAQSFDVTLTDLVFPAKFSALKVAVTRGSDRLGEIVGAGTFSFAATPGSYFVNLLGTPDTTLGYSTVGLNVHATPAAPTVALAASGSSVEAGGSVTLTWSTTDATACTASGDWSGSRATSGSQLVGPLNAASAFTLTCTGPGGSHAATVNVAITAVQRSSGGGGSFDWLAVAALALLALPKLRARQRARHAI